jgi:hypothetical protein
MSDYALSIGGRLIRVAGNDDLALLTRIPGIAPFAVPRQGQPDMTVLLEQPLTIPAVTPLHSFDIADGEVNCTLGRDAEGVYYYSFSSGSCLGFDPRQPQRTLLSPCSDPNVLRFALWTAYAMMGLWQGVQPIHTSTVVWHGQAVLCLGESGTGKSTHTRLWRENIEDAFLLNDDSPIVSVRGDEVEVYGSPWSGKTPCFRTDHYPVAALLRIRQAPHNNIVPLTTLKAFCALQPSCPPATSHDPLLLDRQTDFVGQVISRVRTYILECLPDGDAARLSYRTVFNQ